MTLQSLNATYHALSCTLNAVRALYVLEYTFYDGFESHSLRQFVLFIPRETRIAVCGLCGRFLSLDGRPQKSIILLFCLGEKRLTP